MFAAGRRATYSVNIVVHASAGASVSNRKVGKILIEFGARTYRGAVGKTRFERILRLRRLQLSNVVPTFDLLGPFSRSYKIWDGDCSEQADDADDDHNFYECKPTLCHGSPFSGHGGHGVISDI